MMLHDLIAGAIPLACPPPSRRRSRGPWSPSPAGPYTLPRDVLGRLVVALSGYRNRDAAMALAVFLGRFWSSPKRLVMPFPIDRRALADHGELGLSEARVRGALRALKQVGFIEVAGETAERRYQRTETGPHRKPVLWRFGSDDAKSFAKANTRRSLGRGPASPARRPPAPAQVTPRYLAHNQISPERTLLMGENHTPPDPTSPLEQALARLERAAGMVKRGGTS